MSTFKGDLKKDLPPNTRVVRPDDKQIRAMFSIIRNGDTKLAEFVRCSDRILRAVVEDALSECCEYKDVDVPTPTGGSYNGCQWDGNICGVSIMRAGESMEGVLRELCPAARIGKILIQRNEATAEPDSQYNYCKLPLDISERLVFLLDPMVATGGSAKKALETLVAKNIDPKRIVFLSLLSCPEGLKCLNEAFPDVRVYTAAVDDGLNEKRYIVPGLGDFGDRYFGTIG